MCFDQVMDARDMAELETGSFDAVIDKGLTDSVMYNDKFAIMMAKVGPKAQKEACLTGSRQVEGTAYVIAAAIVLVRSLPRYIMCDKLRSTRSYDVLIPFVALTTLLFAHV